MGWAQGAAAWHALLPRRSVDQLPCLVLSPPLPILSTISLLCSASVEAGLRQQLEAAQRIIRMAQLSKRHEVPADAVGAAAAAEAEAEGAAAEPHEQQEQAVGDGPAGTQQSERSSRAGSGGKGPTGADEGQALDELGLRAGSSEQRLVDAFVQRTSGAALGRAALEQERLRLGAENATLQAVLATVQAGSSVSPGAVEDPLSTLLIVNGRLQKALGGAAAARRVLGGQAAGQQA